MSPECSEMRLAKVLSKPLGLLYAEDQLHPQAESTDLHLGRMWEGQGCVWKDGDTPFPPTSPYTLSMGGQVMS